MTSLSRRARLFFWGCVLAAVAWFIQFTWACYEGRIILAIIGAFMIVICIDMAKTNYNTWRNT